VDKIYLSVVIPSYNEIANLRKGTLDKVEHFLEKQNYNYEVIIVDDGSTDGSLEFVERFSKDNTKFKLIKGQHLGKAGAVTSGMLKAKGELRLFTDMDQATPIEEVNELIPFTENGYDVVVGSRSSHREGAPFTRQFISVSAIILRKIFVGLTEISDTQCGFKLFTEKAADILFNKISKLHHGFHKIKGSSVTAGFDVELLYLAKKEGFKIKEVPVDWLYVETRRVSPVSDSVNGFLDFIKIGVNRFTGKYN
jgi:dolichyl-phosphate beta-glucosyltransferase